MNDVVVFGGINLDIKAKSAGPFGVATSNPGAVTTSYGGVGRNIAANLAQLGARVALISAVGHDASGSDILAATAKAGVDVSNCLQGEFSTGTYCALLDNSGELVGAVSDMEAVKAITPDIVDSHRHSLHEAKYVVADCNLQLETLEKIAALAGEKMIVEPVSVAKSNRLWTLLRSRSIFAATPNLQQAAAATVKKVPLEIARELHSLGMANVVLHAGRHGAYAFDGTVFEHVQAKSADGLIDVTGAGDAAVSGFVFGLLQGFSLLKSAQYGQHLAAKLIHSHHSSLDMP
jgi:pseudouridine kinase